MSVSSVGSNEIVDRNIPEAKPEVEKETPPPAVSVPEKAVDPKDTIEKLAAESRMQANLYVFQNNSSKKAGKHFVKAIKDGQPIQDVIQDSRFTKISEKHLIAAFKKAAENADLPAFTALSTSPRFNEIPSRDLNEAFVTAASNASLAMVKGFLSSTRAHEITAMALSEAIYGSVLSSYTSVFQVLIETAQFREIPSEPLDELFLIIARSGHLPMLQAMIKNGRFEEISDKALVKAMIEAAKYDRLSILQELKKCPRFNEAVTPGKLLMARFEASRRGHQAVADFLTPASDVKVQEVAGKEPAPASTVETPVKA